MSEGFNINAKHYSATPDAENSHMHAYNFCSGKEKETLPVIHKAVQTFWNLVILADDDWLQEANI